MNQDRNHMMYESRLDSRNVNQDSRNLTNWFLHISEYAVVLVLEKPVCSGGEGNVQEGLSCWR